MRQNLIFSRNSSGTELTQERLMQLAPSAFSYSKADHLTERYVSLHTSDLIPVMRDFGYVPVQAAQKGQRKSKAVTTFDNPNKESHSKELYSKENHSKESHSSHMISFAQESSILNSSDTRPEIILYNSHDGSSSVQLYAGCFRFICSNGIVAGDGFKSKMYHSKSGISGFEELLRGTVQDLPLLMERIDALKNVYYSTEQEVEMATRSLELRWDKYNYSTYTNEQYIDQLKGTYFNSNSVTQALRCTRVADRSNDAFTVFNRVQEAVIRGKVNVVSVKDKDSYPMLRKARAVNSVKENLRINSALWDIAESIAFA